jgi:hypothetical protein
VDVASHWPTIFRCGSCANSSAPIPRTALRLGADAEVMNFPDDP